MAPVIERVLGPTVPVVDSTMTTVEGLCEILGERGLAAARSARRENHPAHD